MNSESTEGPHERTVRRQRGEWVIYHRPCTVLVNGKFATVVKPERVRVLSRAEGYAMVRHKGAMPFVVREKDTSSDA